MKIAVGTKNKAKRLAVQNVMDRVLEQSIEVEGLDVASRVSDQPFSDDETRKGAINRATSVREVTGADLAFGLEGGVKWLGNELYLCNWAALSTAQGIYTAAGAQIPLPKEIALALIAGEELGPIMDRYTDTYDIRQNAGAIGIFTDGLINRSQMFEPIIEMLYGQYRYWSKQESCKEQ